MGDLSEAVSQLRAAVQLLAATPGPLHERLQSAWTEHVQTLWENRHLPDPLRDRFETLWKRYTAPSPDPHATTLRTMNERELTEAASELVALAFDAALATSA